MNYKNVFEMLKDYVDKESDYDAPLIGKDDIEKILDVHTRFEKIKEIFYKKSWTEYDDTHGVVTSLVIPYGDITDIMGESNE